MLAKKDDGQFYSMDELAGTGMQNVIGSIPTAEQVFIGVVQARPESSGYVSEHGGHNRHALFI